MTYRTNLQTLIEHYGKTAVYRRHKCADCGRKYHSCYFYSAHLAILCRKCLKKRENQCK